MSKRKISHLRLGWIVVALSIAAVFGYGFYESGNSADAQNPSGGLVVKPTISCQTDSDCPQIECIRAPCPYYVCGEGLCNVVLPSDNGTVNPAR